MEELFQIKEEIDIKIENEQNFQSDGILTKYYSDWGNKEQTETVDELGYASREETKDLTRFPKRKKAATRYAPIESDSSEEMLGNSEDEWSPDKKKKLKAVRNFRKTSRSSKQKGKLISDSATQINVCVKNESELLGVETISETKIVVKDEIEDDLLTEVKSEEDLLKEEKLTCPYCGVKATFPGNLKRHIKEIHIKPEIFMCSYCNFQSTRKSHLNLHINVKHTKENKFKCTFCDFEAFSPNTLRSHLNHLHTLHRWYDCKFCEFKTTHSGNLKVHIQGKHSDKEKFKCKQCNFVSSNKHHLNAHMYQEHESLLLKCPFCPHISKLKSLLGKHFLKEHPEQAKFKCDSCNYKAMTAQSLRMHKHLKHLQRDQNYTCTDCDASYDSFANLKKHRNVKHT